MNFLNKLWIWVSLSLVFSLCLATSAGLALLDTFIIPHAADEDVISESVDFGVGGSFNNSQNNNSQGIVTPDNSSNSNNSSDSNDSSLDNSNNENNSIADPDVSQPPQSTEGQISDSNSALTEAEKAQISKYITTTKIVGTHADSNVNITLTEKVFTAGSDTTTYFVADIRLTSAQYLKTALASGSSLTTNTTKKVAALASANNAVLAINGDGCGQSNRNSGYVVRNANIYRSIARTSSSKNETESFVIYGDGSCEIIDETQVKLSDIQNKWQVFSFGPGLIKDGVIAVTEDQEISGQSMADNPRTAIGMVEPLHYVIIVGNGRTDDSKGLTLYQLAQALRYEGCTVAYNLDGGGSSTLWFKGEVINYPTTNGRYSERAVSDIVYF